jgi:signal transduction histidine kinase
MTESHAGNATSYGIGNAPHSDTDKPLRLHGYILAIARAAWGIVALTALSIAVFNIRANYEIFSTDPASAMPESWTPENLSSALATLNLPHSFPLIYVVTHDLVLVIGFFAVALLIFWFKSDEWIALIAAFFLVSFPENWIKMGESSQGAWLWLSAILNLLTWLSFLYFFLLFPDGRFATPWSRMFALVVAAVTVLVQILNVAPGWLGLSILFSGFSYAAFEQVYRYRYVANALQRQQIKWLVFSFSIGILVLLFYQLLPVWLPSLRQPGHIGLVYEFSEFTVAIVTFLLIPFSISIAIFRYRLWDIDIIINRTLVYGGLTIIVIGIYVLIVGVLGTAIQGSGNLLISILATGLVAVLVQPLRDWLQRGVNRMMYGERDDPVTVLSRLGQRLEATLAPDAVLPSLVETVAQTLKLPYVAIETTTDHRAQPATTNNSSPMIAYGQPRSDMIRLPLIYQSETIGQLLVAPRAQGEVLSPMDRHLLENIAHQAVMAVHAVSLTADLQRSRQHLVTAREEERRRLRRDLHDGLGPNLASQGLKLAAVKQLLEKDPASAAPLLDQVMAQNQATVEEVRRLVYGLRPPALDELGLVAAIRDYVAGTDGNATLHVEITQPPDGLPPLSAAVEVAAYRIVLEALTNVIRHAEAKHCAIRFLFTQIGSNDNLQIEIVDDGIGLPHDLRAGVGLRSMRERAEEVGGWLTVRPAINSGTHIRARLPLIDTLVHSAS